MLLLVPQIYSQIFSHLTHHDTCELGLLGLENMMYYAQTRQEEAIQTLAAFESKQLPFPLVGIKLTMFASEMLRARRLNYLLFRHGVHIDVVKEYYS